jgi:hypothetical protein
MSNAREILDKAFSIYIRRRDCRDGTGRCISCGRPITFTTCDAGHYIPRTHTATRWNIYNVNAQCRECNRMKDGNQAGYRLGLIGRYGLPVVENLERERHTTVKLTDNDYKTLTKFFNQQTAQL